MRKLRNREKIQPEIDPERFRRQISYYLVAAGSVILSAGFFIRPLWEDEVEHLHTIYLLSQGYQPYTDFFQNHPVFIHYLLSPFIQFLPMGMPAVAVSRIFTSMVLLAAMAVLLKCLRGDQRLVAAAVFCSLPVYWVSYHLRPDPFMLLSFAGHFYLLGNYFRTRKSGNLFFSGLLLGLGATILPKALIAAGALPLYQMTHPEQIRFKKLLIFLTGFIVIPVLFIVFFLQHNLLYPYLHNVFAINAQSWVWEDFKPKLITLLVNFAVCIIFVLSFRSSVKGDSHDSRELPGGLIRWYGILTLLAFLLAPFGWHYNLCLFTVCSALLFPRLNLKGLRPAVYRALLVLTCIGLFTPVFILVLRDLINFDETIWRYRQFTYISETVRRGDPVFCIAPLHPIFVRDAGHIYHPWQFYFAAESEDVRAAWFSGWAAGLTKNAPVIIDEGYLKAAVNRSLDAQMEQYELNSFRGKFSYVQNRYKNRVYLILKDNPGQPGRL